MNESRNWEPIKILPIMRPDRALAKYRG